MQRKFQFWISTENSRFWAPDPKRRIKKKSFGSKFWSVWKPLEAILEPRYLRVLKNCTSTDWNRKQFAVRKCQRYCTFILYTILCNCVYIVLDIFLLKCLHHFQNKVVKMSYFQFVSCHLLSETEYFVPCNKKACKKSSSYLLWLLISIQGQWLAGDYPATEGRRCGTPWIVCQCIGGPATKKCCLITLEKKKLLLFVPFANQTWTSTVGQKSI